jgi:hypothetical protein
MEILLIPPHADDSIRWARHDFVRLNKLLICFRSGFSALMAIHTLIVVHRDSSSMTSKSIVLSKKKLAVDPSQQVRKLLNPIKSFKPNENFNFSAVGPVTDAPLDLALKCDTGECQLPYCYCSKDGTSIPKDLSAEDVSWKLILSSFFKDENFFSLPPKQIQREMFQSYDNLRGKVVCRKFSALCFKFKRQVFMQNIQKLDNNEKLLISPTVILLLEFFHAAHDISF